jgi:hypothetical protein
MPQELWNRRAWFSYRSELDERLKGVELLIKMKEGEMKGARKVEGLWTEKVSYDDPLGNA